MEFGWDDEHSGYRAELVSFLNDELPSHWHGETAILGSNANTKYSRRFAGLLAERGWLTPHWPADFGGYDASPWMLAVLGEELWSRGEPRGPQYMNANWIGPSIMANGTPEQQARYLPPISRGDVIWCQGFSEPNSGSDLASLSTKGVVDGDELVVTGQKIWTSYADVADYQELLVRTDPTAPKHKGISWVICDMSTPGIEVRPIDTMAHHTDFAEVFYDEVRIPLTNVVGELNDGWRVAMSTLSFERGTAFMADQIELAATVEELIVEARNRCDARGRARIDDDEIARRLATARAEVAALRSMTVAGISRTRRSGMPGPEGSLIRAFHGELHQRVYQLGMEIIGTDALGLTPIDGDGNWTGPYLQSFAYTIGGGTTDIQRNIVGERVLGLPRPPR